MSQTINCTLQVEDGAVVIHPGTEWEEKMDVEEGRDPVEVALVAFRSQLKGRHFTGDEGVVVTQKGLKEDRILFDTSLREFLDK